MREITEDIPAGVNCQLQ